MALPKSIVASSIKYCCICYFKDTLYAEDVPPHLYVVLPVSKKTALICTIITSQISKREKYYNRTNPQNKDCLIKVDKSSLPCLEKTSIIDCNQTQLIYINELDSRIDDQYGFRVEMRKIPIPLQEDIKAAIKNSTVVKEYIKSLI